MKWANGYNNQSGMEHTFSLSRVYILLCKLPFRIVIFELYKTSLKRKLVKIFWNFQGRFKHNIRIFHSIGVIFRVYFFYEKCYKMPGYGEFWSGSATVAIQLTVVVTILQSLLGYRVNSCLHVAPGGNPWTPRELKELSPITIPRPSKSDTILIRLRYWPLH